MLSAMSATRLEPAQPDPPGAPPASGAGRLPLAPALGVLVLAAVLAWNLFACRNATEGHFTYVLDDSYIELAMARNLAQHGSWGVNPGQFEPAASSPLWTALLALAVRVAGDHAWLPFALNAGLCALLLLLVHAFLRAAVPAPRPRAALATAIVLLAPATAFAVTGMEHGLHALLALALTWFAAARIFLGDDAAPGDGPAPARVATPWLFALAALTTLARFESVALVGVLAAAAALRRRWRLAFALLAGPAVAVAAYAAYAVPQGGLWLPNSVLVKSRLGLLRSGTFDWSLVLGRIPGVLSAPRNAHFPVLLALALAVAALRPRGGGAAWRTGRGVLLVLVPVVLLQVQFADVGSFFRYESWLVPIALVALMTALAAHARDRGPAGPRAWAGMALAGVLAAALAGLLLVRAQHAVAWAPLASRNIYEQQRQTARFVHEEFPGETVAVSDIGAVAWYGGVRVLDLAGLGSMSVGRARIADLSKADWLERYCAEHDARVAVLYDAWLAGRGGVPGSWRAHSRWVIRDNFAADRDTVTVFSTSAADEERVREALERFEPTLPRRVTVLRAAPR